MPTFITLCLSPHFNALTPSLLSPNQLMLSNLGMHHFHQSLYRYQLHSSHSVQNYNPKKTNLYTKESSIEMDKERLTAEMDFKDSSSSSTSVVIKIKKSLPDFLQSVKLKYVKLGYKCTCDYSTLLRWFVIIPLFIATTIQITGIRFDQVSNLWRSRGAVDMATALTGFTLLLFLLTLYWVKRPRPVYLVDFSCFKPDDSLKSSVESFIKMTEDHASFEEPTIQFQKRISIRSGLGDETYIPTAITSRPPRLNMKEARAEAEMVMFGSLDTLFDKTGIHPSQVGILIVNCSLFCPTPSLSSMIVNHYKMRTDIKSFNLGGMGCSAGLISIDLAKDLLKSNPNTYAVVVSMENITLNWYFGNDKSMLLCNCIFRMGGAAVLLSNMNHDRAKSKYELVHTVRTHKGADDNSYNCVYQREDEEKNIGVSLDREFEGLGSIWKEKKNILIT